MDPPFGPQNTVLSDDYNPEASSSAVSTCYKEDTMNDKNAVDACDSKEIVMSDNIEADKCDKKETSSEVKCCSKNAWRKTRGKLGKKHGCNRLNNQAHNKAAWPWCFAGGLRPLCSLLVCV